MSLSFRDLLVGTELEAVIVHIPEGDTFQAEQQTCQLLGNISLSPCLLSNNASSINYLEKGVVAIFGPLSKASSEHIKYITDSVEIPYIETRWNYRSQNVIGRWEVGEVGGMLSHSLDCRSGGRLLLQSAPRYYNARLGLPGPGGGLRLEVHHHSLPGQRLHDDSEADLRPHLLH